MDLRERNAPTGTRHPWELVRASYFSRKIASLANGKVVRVLDLGSGDCWFAEQLLSQLAPNSSITCCDIHFTDDDLLITTASGITKTREIPTEQFDIIILLDVIEHIEFDEEFLATQVAPRLQPQGSIVISVPAHPSLFSAHDTFLGHYRRYTKRHLLDTANQRFLVGQNGYLFTSLAFVRWIQAKRRDQHAQTELGVGAWTAGPLLTFLVTSALHIDALVFGALQKIGIRIPGLTVWAVCKSQTGKQQTT